MFNLIANIAVTIATSVASLWGVYHYAPLSILESGTMSKHQQMFGGTSITTIQGSDTLSASRTTLNNNFASLNTNKVEISDLAATTSLRNLASIGTITTGVWNATTITVPFGGTGSTTLSSNQVLLGNGTGALKTMSGWGTSGQFLTSQGNGVTPIWSTASIDQSLAYTWTGLHTFNTGGIISNASSTITATTTIAASSVTNKALVLNTIPYAFPSLRGASSTVLTEDGNGNLTWQLSTTTAAAGVMVATTSSGGATSGDNNAVQTVGFMPSFIRVNFYLKGHTPSAGTNIVTETKGTAFYRGTTLVYSDVLWQTDSTSGAISLGSFTQANSPVDGGTPVTGSNSGNSGAVETTLSVPTLTSTGFTIRCAFRGGGNNTGACNASWEAFR